MSRKRVAVIGGGDSAEIEISMLSQQCILDHIDDERYEKYKVLISDDSWTVELNGASIPIDRTDFSFNKDGEKVNFDVAYIIIHGPPGENGILQAYFDLLHIPYTTPNHLNSTITFNKWACNQLLKSLGYNCANSVILRNKEITAGLDNEIKLPAFVKPNDGGSSFGVSKVNDIGGLVPAIQLAYEHGTEVLIEEALIGTEVTCGVFRSAEGVKALPVTEIVSENEFFDYEAKYAGKSSEITPARLDEAIYKKVQDTTESIYKNLNLHGVSRIDYIIQEGEPYVIEINTVPGMSPESIIPQQANEAGIGLMELVSEVIEQARYS